MPGSFQMAQVLGVDPREPGALQQAQDVMKRDLAKNPPTPLVIGTAKAAPAVSHDETKES